MMKRLLITGASGFVGKALVSQLLQRNIKLTISHRKEKLSNDSAIKSVFVGDLHSATDWTQALDDCNIVVHLAARVHIMNDTAHDPLAEFRQINVEATINLAQQAVVSGIKRFIYISSIKAAEAPSLKTPSLDPYGTSKYEAEQALLALADKTGLEVVIIRPPLVYGSDVKGNFLLLLRCMQKGIPLPLGAINNQRSLIALDNLVDFIIHTLDHPKAVNQILTVSDGQDISTTELLRRIATAYGKKARLIPVPSTLLRLVLKYLGKKAMADRLIGSLQVDSSKASELLGWKPVISMEKQLKKIVESSHLK
jgi:nucleoside-diphosphate-sugar epimerase